MQRPHQLSSHVLSPMIFAYPTELRERLPMKSFDVNPGYFMNLLYS